MKVGLTYDLRQDYLNLGMSEEDTAEFDRPDTIVAIENTLKALGYETDRIGHIRSLVNRLAQGHSWDMVFNIAEGLWGFGREAQIPALLEAYQIPYTFSDSLVLALTLHKGLTKHVIRDQGIPTPDFYVLEKEADLKHLHLSFPLFAKPVAEGTGKGITAKSVIQTKRELTSVCRMLLTAYQQPVLIETFLPGREFTVGIVGTGEDAKAVGVLEVVLLKNAEQDVYSYVNKEKCEELVEYHLAEDDMAKAAANVAIASWRALGCRDAGRIDLRSDEKGQPHFIEVNPLAGIHPEHSDLPILCSKVGIPYKELIKTIMQSAEKRLPTKKK